MNELKPCPCCGYEAIMYTEQVRKGWEAEINCNGCLLSYHTITYDFEQEAENAGIEAWNLRTPLHIDTLMHGKWIFDNKIPYCSECNETAILDSGHHYLCTDFCSYCGAKMDKKGE